MAELMAITKDGGSVTFPKKPMEIERIGELIDTLRTMVANEEERVRADIARNQTNLEILATLQALIRKQGENRKPTETAVDFGPLVQILTEMQAERENRERGAYEFEIRRDGRGFAQRIIATPAGPTTH